MAEFLIIARDYCQNPASMVIFCIALIITLILVAALFLSSLAFFGAMVLNICTLYSRPAQENLSKFHPYTRSILENRCPEFKRIRELQAMPRTGYTRGELKKVIQSVIDTLEENESEPVKDTIIRQLKAL